MFKEYVNHDGVSLSSLIKSREVSAAEIMETAITLADRVDPKLNFMAVDCAEVGRALAAKPLP